MRKTPSKVPEQKQKFEEQPEDALKQVEDFYIDPETGYRVWTESYLRKRGTCCNSSCRHCPYR